MRSLPFVLICTASVDIVEFTLFGQAFTAFSAGPHHEFNDAISLMVLCESQAELDKYWDAIEKNGGRPQACGWIIDKFGVRWHIRELGDWAALPMIFLIFSILGFFAQPISAAPPSMNRPDWNAVTRVEPAAKLSGSTWVPNCAGNS